MAADLALEDRKVGADAGDVERGLGRDGRAHCAVTSSASATRSNAVARGLDAMHAHRLDRRQ